MSKKKLFKRGQMEIMGLMIIVILVVMGVLFALKFVILKPPTPIKQHYMTTQMVSNFGIALLHSTTDDCRGTDLSELMIDCANWKEVGGSITCGNGRNSCDYVKDTLGFILNETLEIWRVKYYFKAGNSPLAQDQIFNFSSQHTSCSEGVPGEAEQFFLPTDRGLLTFKLFICD
ncbi:hypothetical protein HOK51_10145 [Candidatus Woesearchaeota archaeon]|jgi:hypothetical protein|nr:hypothetical protein [Candidatus Woesearchaeota archaeon]MBT6520185.1 hypothetical protein [Candidatus Woesearchaeota archaeon]MBT7367189.1 hypothetical protein [Candidatus Woesearchaeota archaeon]